jgi:hypothetical protein
MFRWANAKLVTRAEGKCEGKENENVERKRVSFAFISLSSTIR